MLTLPSTVESQAWDMEGSYLLYLIIPLSGISEFPPSLQLGVCFYLLVLTLTLFGLFVCFVLLLTLFPTPIPSFAIFAIWVGSYMNFKGLFLLRCSKYPQNSSIQSLVPSFLHYNTFLCHSLKFSE